MKIRYAINARIPTERAHGLQVMKTCEALARAGAEVELVVPERKNEITADPFVYYGVKKIFAITYLPTLDFMRFGIPFAFALQTYAFTFSLARYLGGHDDGSALYLRGELGWLLPRFSRATFFWENHIKLTKRRAEARALRRARGTVVVTEHYKADLVRDYDIPSDSILVAPDGVDLAEFAHAPTKAEARARLGLPEGGTLALYAGSDLPWKGLRHLREAARLLPEGYELVFVGPITAGSPTPHERFVGARPHEEIPLWLAAADVLVLTGDPTSSTARYYTSPMKLFEYMAAGRPIVASDLPAFREVLSEESATLVPAGDAAALAEGVVRAATDPAQGARAQRAREIVAGYSWDVRAEHLRAFIGGSGEH